MKIVLSLVLLLVTVGASARPAQPSYPPIQAYLMERSAEISLARSAAPDTVSGPATIKILTTAGYRVATRGSNGFTCIVMRGFAAPTYTPAMFRNLVYDPKVRAPICFNEPASRTVLPYYELRTKLGMEGKSPDEIALGVERANRSGALPKRAPVSFGYMWSADQYLGPLAGHWHPHVMIFAPNYQNAMIGGNAFGSALPQVTDDAGTPFTVIVVPVDMALFIKAKR